MSQARSISKWYTLISKIILVASFLGSLQACAPSLRATDIPTSTEVTGIEIRETPESNTAQILPTERSLTELAPIPLFGTLVYADHLGIYTFDFSTYESRDLDVENGTSYEDVSVANGVVYFLRAGGKSNTNDIYGININGNNLDRLTKDEYNDFHHNIAPDGRYLSFETYWEAPYNLYKLFVMDTDSKNRILIAENTNNQYGSILWSPDSKTLIFFENGNQETGDQLFLFEMETKELKEFDIQISGQITNLTWSPHGGYVVLGLDNISQSGIYLLNIQTNELRQLMLTNGSPRNFVWSPDGKKILFELLNPGDYSLQLHMLNMEDGKIVTIQEDKLEGAHFSYHALWSPDDKYIAYFIDLDRDNWRLKLQDIETSKSWELELPHAFPNSAIWTDYKR